MCTIVFAYGVFDGLAVASNRDESYGRGFAPPEVRRDEGGWLCAPRDELEGGTWIGFNDEGVVVTLSNLPVYDDETRSRGALVDDLLRSPTVADARERLRDSYARHDYEGFNVVAASSEDCFVGVNDGDLRVVEPDEGVHVVANTPFDDPGEKTRRVSDAISEPDGDTDPGDWLDSVRPVLADHDLRVCVHDEERGTTSSNLLYVGSDPCESSWLFADGAPCETSYESSFQPPKEL